MSCATVIQIQSSVGFDSKIAPLILIHDGGGTIFQYFLLDALDRPTYGIANPWFDDPESFFGNMEDLASIYARAIRDTFKPGQSVLLGGWSFGGLLSVEIGAQLSRSRDSPRVAGLVLIDSMFPGHPEFRSTVPLTRSNLLRKNSTTRSDTYDKINSCFAEAQRMIKAWELPKVWISGARSVEIADCALRTPPHAAVLRAADSLNHEAKECRGLDFYRTSKYLGWEDINEDFALVALEVPGNHFSIFDPENIHELSEKLRQACSMLDACQF